MDFLLTQKGNAIAKSNSRSKGYTPLILATMLGHKVVVQGLLYYGDACPRYSSSYGSLLQQKMALDWACGTGQGGSVSLLLQQGANPTARKDLSLILPSFFFLFFNKIYLLHLLFLL